MAFKTLVRETRASGLTRRQSIDNGPEKNLTRL